MIINNKIKSNYFANRNENLYLKNMHNIKIILKMQNFLQILNMQISKK